MHEKFKIKQLDSVQRYIVLNHIKTTGTFYVHDVPTASVA